MKIVLVVSALGIGGVIEFSPQGTGGDKTLHVHTIYRDPTNDYGVKVNGAE
jgi:hypothetical protein